MTIIVERAGLLTTVQDLGRPGHQHEGVPVGGAMDDVALRIANLLAGNVPGAAALEVTLAAPTLRFASATRIAVAGADMAWTVDGRPIGNWRSLTVPDGGVLAGNMARSGCRAYVAVDGGIDVPESLGSRSTFVAAELGGVEGRALRAGDVIACGADAHAMAEGKHRAPRGGHRIASPAARPVYGGVVRLVAGPRLDALTAESRVRLLDETLRVSAHSDRMGVRLEVGGEPLSVRPVPESVSAGVAMGTVQLPPGGAPIILMADRQTTGGYPRLGEIATVDLPLVAQLRPGEQVRFAVISLAEAQRLYLARERELALLARVLAVPA
jgi:antagonist of KipI